ncbi:MAG TPA: DUF6448 family protein [Thermoanaerobaculia bacterium]|nr:DUF6448 family protein [Thermoanaerobaculia bacterium]
MTLALTIPRTAAMVAALVAVSAIPDRAIAHCDSLAGPVVQDARLALDRRDPTPVLKWVDQHHEDEIREAFDRTLEVRAQGDAARELADRFFFETLVRIHRAGEGEAFTGLKPASKVDPGIAAADEALRAGSAQELAGRLSAAVEAGVAERLAIALQRKEHATDSVEAGREYVAAYVDYVHFVESLERLVSQGAPHTHHD